MICAIHQPNFFPWFPFFQKVAAVDVFVVLSDCQFEKNGYQNRFWLGGKWHTMSVNKGLESIRNKVYPFWMKDWNRICGQLSQYSDILLKFKDDIGPTLLDTNIRIINRLARMLVIDTPIHLDRPTGATSTERLIRLCQMHNCDTYLSGVSGRKYLDIEAFKRASIEILFQKEEAMNKRSVLEVLHAAV